MHHPLITPPNLDRLVAHARLLEYSIKAVKATSERESTEAMLRGRPFPNDWHKSGALANTLQQELVATQAEITRVWLLEVDDGAPSRQ